MVNNARERLKRGERGERTKKPYKEPYHNRYRETHDSVTNHPRRDESNIRNTISKIQEANTHYKSRITSLKRKITSKKKDDADIEDSGITFGGKSKRKKGSST